MLNVCVNWIQLARYGNQRPTIMNTIMDHQVRNKLEICYVDERMSNSQEEISSVKLLTKYVASYHAAESYLKWDNFHNIVVKCNSVHEANQSLLSRPDVKNTWNYASNPNTPSYPCDWRPDATLPYFFSLKMPFTFCLRVTVFVCFVTDIAADVPLPTDTFACLGNMKISTSFSTLKEVQA